MISSSRSLLATVSDEARNVEQYNYGDLIPYRYGAPPRSNETVVRVAPGIIGDRYLHETKHEQDKSSIARFQTDDEWRRGWTPPPKKSDSPKKTEQSKKSDISFAKRTLIIFGILCVIAFIMNHLIYSSVLSDFYYFFWFLFKPIFWLLNLFGITHYLVAETIAFAVVSVLISFLISWLKKPSEDRDITDADESYKRILKDRNTELKKQQNLLAYCEKTESEIAPLEAKARQELNELYTQNLIHPKYRNFVAVSQICEYFETGRCDTLTGPNGAYNLFEAELRANVIIIKLDNILEKLDDIKSMQYMIYEAIMTTNSLLGSISNELSQVTDAVIANTAAIENFNASVSSRLR